MRSAGVEKRRLHTCWNCRGEDAAPPAEVLALGGESLPSSATISTGRQKNAHVGDVVVTEDGLLGRVSEVYGSMARVVLLTDPNSAVAAEVESTSVLGVCGS